MTQAAGQGGFTAAPDIPLTVLTPPSYPNPVRAERRITPGWSLATLKRKLEPVVGIPPSAQRLLLRWPDGRESKVEVNESGGEDEQSVSIGQWGLVRYAELEVRDNIFHFFVVSFRVYIFSICISSMFGGRKNSVKIFLCCVRRKTRPD